MYIKKNTRTWRKRGKATGLAEGGRGGVGAAGGASHDCPEEDPAEQHKMAGREEPPDPAVRGGAKRELARYVVINIDFVDLGGLCLKGRPVSSLGE